ncbi:MAG: hypothetical protein AAF594_06140 [Bacteroidota bacterium]
MGKYTLLVVLAAIVGGSLLTVDLRGTLRDMSSRHADDQADVVARQIAESAQSVVLSRMMGTGGFVNPGIGGPQPYEGGVFEVSLDSLSPALATVSVTGTYGGAVHTIRSTYEFDRMNVPGPLWLDVPYATATTTPGARITGNAEAPDVRFDRRKYDDLRLSGFLPFGALQSNLDAAMTAAGNDLNVPNGGAWGGNNGLLEDLNVDDTESLYQTAIASMGPSDLRLAGDQTVTGSATWGGDDEITLVDGSLRIEGLVRGEGALVVNGDMQVAASGRLDWEGLVLVRDTTDVLDLELDGIVTITGALAVAHDALPPGGHLDMSIYRDAGGMSSAVPQGNVSSRAHPWNDGQPYPWHQHTHAFDVTPVGAERGRHVYFMEGGGSGRHEAETQFHDLIQALGSEEVYLEFANTSHHGFARFGLEVDGLPDPITGMVRSGFGGFAHANSDLRTRPFPADDLRHFDVNILSLRALRQAFDTVGGCTEWPICIGYEWNRKNALAIRVRRASNNARLYEATMYWHMRPDERAAHEAEEQAWRDAILAGAAFGTHVTLGDRVDLALDTGEILELADKMGFDGNEVIHLSTSAAHQTSEETRAAASSAPTIP